MYKGEMLVTEGVGYKMICSNVNILLPFLICVISLEWKSTKLNTFRQIWSASDWILVWGFLLTSSENVDLPSWHVGVCTANSVTIFAQDQTPAAFLSPPNPRQSRSRQYR